MIVMVEVYKIMLNSGFQGGSRGGRGGGQGVQTPPPLKNRKNIGFLIVILVRIPWEIRKLPSHQSMLGNHRPASEMPFNGVSLAGR